MSSCCSVAKSCLTLCNPMDCGTPGFPVFQDLPEFAQTQGHWVSDAIQPAHPRSPLLLLPSVLPSIRVFSNESALNQVTKVLELQLQLSVLPMNIQGWFPLGWTDLMSLLSKGLSRVFSSTTIRKYLEQAAYKHQLKMNQRPKWKN